MAVPPGSWVLWTVSASRLVCSRDQRRAMGITHHPHNKPACTRVFGGLTRLTGPATPARRREGQVSMALAAAADNAVSHLLPHAPTLEGVVVGGERTAVDAVLADRRLAALRPLVTGRLLDVPDTRLAVLRGAGELARRVHIRVVDPS